MTSILGGSSAAVGLIPGSTTEPIAEPETGSDSPAFLAAPAEQLDELADDSGRRLVVRLLGGDELELGDFEDRGDAVEAAQELVARFSSAEASGEWPEVDGRFLRPASIASVDVLVKS